MSRLLNAQILSSLSFLSYVYMKNIEKLFFIAGVKVIPYFLKKFFFIFIFYFKSKFILYFYFFFLCKLIIEVEKLQNLAQ